MIPFLALIGFNAISFIHTRDTIMSKRTLKFCFFYIVTMVSPSQSKRLTGQHKDALGAWQELLTILEEESRSLKPEHPTSQSCSKLKAAIEQCPQGDFKSLGTERGTFYNLVETNGEFERHEPFHFMLEEGENNLENVLHMHGPCIGAKGRNCGFTRYIGSGSSEKEEHPLDYTYQAFVFKDGASHERDLLNKKFSSETAAVLWLINRSLEDWR